MILRLSPRIKIEMVHVPGGEFLMGSDLSDESTYDDEKSMHAVSVPEFFIARYPVTQAQYGIFLAAARMQLSAVPKSRLDHPVTRVTWYDAQEFCQWVGRATGQIVRLPTEAEWEKAARGVDGRLWPWGNTPGETAMGNFRTTATAMLRLPDGRRLRYSYTGDTIEVGRFSPESDSYYGCADVSGNVWEWTHSLYRPYPYRADDGREIEDDLGMRVLRGGSFLSNPNRARCTSRLRQPAGNRFSVDLGFRVCVSGQ